MEKSDPEIVLEARHISKQFPGVLALDDVSLKVYAGKVNAIVGENGAGKSTLMNILSGVYPDYQGEVLLCGRPVRFSGTADAQRQGIAMIHQELNLIPGKLFPGRLLLLSGESMWMATGLFRQPCKMGQPLCFVKKFPLASMKIQPSFRLTIPTESSVNWLRHFTAFLLHG
jgi:ABC-type branched-subunit amino acid transport system ATPase component